MKTDDGKRSQFKVNIFSILVIVFLAVTPLTIIASPETEIAKEIAGKSRDELLLMTTVAAIGLAGYLVRELQKSNRENRRDYMKSVTAIERLADAIESQNSSKNGFQQSKGFLSQLGGMTSSAGNFDDPESKG